jgi:hypothetical protein
MSRIPGGVDTVTVPPTNNMYTALAGAGFVMCLVGLIILWMRSTELFGGSGIF